MLLRGGLALFVAVMLPASVAFAGDGKAGKLEIRGAFSRATSGNADQTVAGAFMTITNTGSEADKLVGARSMIAESGGTHTHVRDGGVVNMVPVGAIDIPAGHTATLQPGGMHVMFHGLNKPLAEGGKYSLTLKFAKSGEATLAVEVLNSAAMTYPGAAVMGPGMAGAPMMSAPMSAAQPGSRTGDAAAAMPKDHKH